MKLALPNRARNALIAVALVACATSSERELDFSDETTRINYSLGYQIGGDFERQGVSLDADAVVQGIRDALAGGEPQLSQPDMHQTLVDLKRRIVAEQRSRRTGTELQRINEGREFLEQNAQEPGVVTTESGLQYRILAPGEGNPPAPGDRVTCRYRGTLINGNVFDSAQEEPATFELDRVIPGWTEGLQLIGEGGRIELFIPPDLAYRDSGPLAHRTLIFEIELLSVNAES